jgi:hypothetical protein
LPPDGVESARPGAPGCTLAAAAALETAKRTKGALKAATATLDSARSEWEAVRDVASLIGARLDGPTQAAVLRSARALAVARSAQARANAVHLDTLENVTETRTVAWPPGGNTTTGSLPSLGSATLRAWVTGGYDLGQAEVAMNIERSPPREQSAGAASIGGSSASIAGESATLGLRYRTPMNGMLIARSPSFTEPKLLAAGPVPQLGQMMVLPFWNGSFQQNALGATFAEDGRLLTASYGDSANRAERLSETAAKLAQMAPQAAAEIAAARNFAVERETARVRARRDLYQPLRDERTAQAALAPSPEDPSERRRKLFATESAVK